MELPNYRLPGAKNVLQLMWDKAKDFLQRAFTVIFMASLVIWFLQTFGLHLSMVADSKDSILAAVAGAIAPIFAPLGFGDWRICTSLIAGFMAKESVVSTCQYCLEVQRHCWKYSRRCQQHLFLYFVFCTHHVLQQSLPLKESWEQNGQ